MPYSFHGINTMSSALRAFQVQLDVTGENISNAETVGYNRRTVSLDQGPGIAVTVGKTVSLGQGVNVAAVTRVRDMFLAGRRAETESKLGRGEESLAGLTKIQSAMAEPGDDGVSAAYDALVNAFSALSASPNDPSAKAEVQLAGERFASKVSNFSKDLDAQRADNVTRTKEILFDIDTKTSKIAGLNTRIAEASARGGVPNDLLDERDSVVMELSSLADVTVTKGIGGYDVSLNGFRLVDPSGSNPMSSKFDFTSGRIAEGTTTFPVYGGALAGTNDIAAAINATSARLDSFADTARTEVNALFMTGKTAAGVTGMPFFAEPVPPMTSLGAVGLRLDDPIAADANNIPSGTSGLSGDGTLAAQISALRDKKIAGLGGQTMGSYYSSLVSDVGRQTAAAKDSVDVQQAVAQQIDAQISETSGVSMDEEMANLLRYQRAYQAAAKALSTFDSMSETIINMLNR
jgi:flagellar hook-associated protein 1 FlgK